MPPQGGVCRWHPPPKSEYKLNFDAAFLHGTTYTGVVLRNDIVVVLGAWTNCFQSENAFCAETEAAVQAFKIADSLRLDRTTIEGDALNVIQALLGVPEVEDWRAKHRINEGKRLLNSHLFWFLNYTPRDENFCAYRLDKWAVNSLVCGQVDLGTLPPTFWEDEIT